MLPVACLMRGTSMRVARRLREAARSPGLMLRMASIRWPRALIRSSCVLNANPCLFASRSICSWIRRDNLLATFEAASSGVDELWIALEPGHRGARRTGLAMTDDRRLATHGSLWKVAVRRATRDGPESEQTAGIVWDALLSRPGRVLLWNVFPLHCHKPGRALSNRRHTRSERLACAELTADIVDMVSPRRIVAIGRDAQAAMAPSHPTRIPVRHPSYGGKAEFLAGVNG